MALAFALPTAGFIHLDENQNPVYSLVNLHDGMPVFSPNVVTNAINKAFAAGVDIAIQYHVNKANEMLEAKNYFLAKIHADAADAIKAAGETA